MAEHLVSIYGTEKDKVNCPFYYKIGACRHGDRCSRVHNKPLFSQTLMFSNLYHSPDQIEEYARLQGLPLPDISPEDRENHFEDFYQDVKIEMSKFGPVEAIFVCDNLAEHLIGNTYVKFESEEDAKEALAGLKGRYYAGSIVKVEFSPVTDFKEGKCRTFEEFGKCKRGDYCHFMHLKKHRENMSDKYPYNSSYGGGRGSYRGKNFMGGYQRGGYRARSSANGRTYSTYDYRDEGEKRERDNRDSREYKDRDRDRDSKYSSSPALSDDRFDGRRSTRDGGSGGYQGRRSSTSGRRSTYDRDDYDRDGRDGYSRRGRGGYRASSGGYPYTRQHPKHRDTYGEYDYRKDS